MISALFCFCYDYTHLLLKDKMSLASNETNGGHSLHMRYCTPIQSFSSILSYSNSCMLVLMAHLCLRDWFLKW